MAPKGTRKRPTPRPAWVLKPGSATARKEWDAARVAEPELRATERHRLVERPTDRGDDPSRTHQLKGKLATRQVGTDKLPQWQHELTSGGRISYCVDKTNRTIWITKVALAHPKETD